MPKIISDGRELLLLFIMALLKTQKGEVRVEDLSKQLAVSSKDLLSAVQQLDVRIGTKYLGNKLLVSIPSDKERVQLAIAAIILGGSVEEVASILTWRQFETFCTDVLEENSYSCIHGFRFKSSRGRRYECDVVGERKPLILIADCKHYGRRLKGLRNTVERHLERVEGFARSITTIIREIPRVAEWQEGTVVPFIVTLLPERLTIESGVPIVPAYKLNQFVQEVPSYVEDLAQCRIEPSRQKRLLDK